MGNVKIKRQVSAGGVAFRDIDHRLEVALISVGERRRWQLPKGIINPGETEQVAALREVREEAGIQTELLEPLDKIQYWYYGNEAGERCRYHKIVYFFLLRYIAGDVQEHDHEVNEARWVEIDKAISQLTFEDEKEIVRKAKNRIAEIKQGTGS